MSSSENRLPIIRFDSLLEILVSEAVLFSVRFACSVLAVLPGGLLKLLAVLFFDFCFSSVLVPFAIAIKSSFETWLNLHFVPNLQPSSV